MHQRPLQDVDNAGERLWSTSCLLQALSGNLAVNFERDDGLRIKPQIVVIHGRLLPSDIADDAIFSASVRLAISIGIAALGASRLVDHSVSKAG